VEGLSCVRTSRLADGESSAAIAIANSIACRSAVIILQILHTTKIHACLKQLPRTR
jgi:hypothetical protein